MSSNEIDADATGPEPVNVCVVEAIDANGSVSDRTAFATVAEAQAHAAAMTAKGCKVTLSPLPKV